MTQSSSLNIVFAMLFRSICCRSLICTWFLIRLNNAKVDDVSSLSTKYLWCALFYPFFESFNVPSICAQLCSASSYEKVLHGPGTGTIDRSRTFVVKDNGTSQSCLIIQVNSKLVYFPWRHAFLTITTLVPLKNCEGNFYVPFDSFHLPKRLLNA